MVPAMVRSSCQVASLLKQPIPMHHHLPGWRWRERKGIGWKRAEVETGGVGGGEGRWELDESGWEWEEGSRLVSSIARRSTRTSPPHSWP